jgi:hypothetical protein
MLAGLPASYDGRAAKLRCRPTAEDYAEYYAEDAKHFAAARESLLRQMDERRNLEASAWAAGRAATWTSPTRDLLTCAFDGHEFEPLIRLGKATLPVLGARIRKGHEDEMFCRLMYATITGEVDTDYVRGLLAGSVEDQAWACDLIAAAGSTAWFTELRTLALGASEGPRVSAAACLATCHPLEAVPIVKQAAALEESSEHKFGLCQNLTRDLELAITKAQVRWAAP